MSIADVWLFVAQSSQQLHMGAMDRRKARSGGERWGANEVRNLSGTGVWLQVIQ
jgi:hypothetical protein